MMLRPAVTLRKRMAQRAYHCQVDRASWRVNSCVDRWAWFFTDGCQPSGTQPSGGLRMTEAPATTAIRYAIARIASDHKYLRICDLCKELGIACLHAHIAAERERQARTDAGLVPLCPLASIVPVFWR